MRIAALLAACFVTAAQAVTQSTDFSDLWFNPDEEGWGVNLIQQSDIVFLTLFVYGANGQPTWYVGPATRLADPSTPGTVVFSGPLFAVTGPYFGASTFNESQVQPRQVGNVAFAASAISVGAISYTVDGVSVTKSVQRQTWRNENINGNYIGGVAGDYSNCGAARNGYIDNNVTLVIGHDGGSTVTMREQGSNYSCNYTGGYTQAGRMGTIQGNATCSDGTNQGFIATEVQASIQGITMRLGSQFSNGCVFTGRMGGVRRTP
jgi:hypothetical protein